MKKIMLVMLCLFFLPYCPNGRNGFADTLRPYSKLTEKMNRMECLDFKTRFIAQYMIKTLVGMTDYEMAHNITNVLWNWAEKENVTVYQCVSCHQVQKVTKVGYQKGLSVKQYIKPTVCMVCYSEDKCRNLCDNIPSASRIDVIEEVGKRVMMDGVVMRKL